MDHARRMKDEKPNVTGGVFNSSLFCCLVKCSHKFPNDTLSGGGTKYKRFNKVNDDVKKVSLS